LKRARFIKRRGRSGPIQTIGKADLKKPGSDAVIVTWGTMVGPSLEAAETLRKEGIDAGVLDLRWLAPLDVEGLRGAVVRANGRAVVAHEANLTGGFGAEIVARLHETLGGALNPRIRRVGAPDIRVPAAPILARQLLPNAERIATAVRAVIGE